MRKAVFTLLFCALFAAGGATALSAPVPLGPATTTRVPSFNAIVADGAHFFQLVESAHQALWRTDGTPEGTLPVFETDKGTIPFVAGGDSLVYFIAEDALGATLNVVGGAEKEPRPLAPVFRGEPFGMVVSGDNCFWYSRLGGVGSLWTSDGTKEGTREVRNFQYPQGLPPEMEMEITQAKPLAAVPGGVVLGAPHPGVGVELWFSDGTEKGTVLVADLLPAPKGAEAMAPLLSSVPTFEPYKGGFAYFSISGALTGNESPVYRTDGTKAGTAPASKPTVDLAASDVFTVEPGGIFRAAYGGREVAMGRIDLSNADLSNRDGYLYFYGNDGETGWEVWRARNNPATLERMTDLNPGAGDTAPQWEMWPPTMVVLGNRLLFWGNDGKGGMGLFALDIAKDDGGQPPRDGDAVE